MKALARRESLRLIRLAADPKHRRQEAWDRAAEARISRLIEKAAAATADLQLYHALLQEANDLLQQSLK